MSLNLKSDSRGLEADALHDRLPSGAVQIAVAIQHSCARMADDTVAKPVSPTGLGVVDALWAGGSAACACRPTGDVLCWGHYGLQDGARDTWYSARPRVIPWLHGATSIALGMVHSCAILADGDAGC